MSLHKCPNLALVCPGDQLWPTSRTHTLDIAQAYFEMLRFNIMTYFTIRCRVYFTSPERKVPKELSIRYSSCGKFHLLPALKARIFDSTMYQMESSQGTFHSGEVGRTPHQIESSLGTSDFVPNKKFTASPASQHSQPAQPAQPASQPITIPYD